MSSALFGPTTKGMVSALIALVATGCVSTRATTYETEFDPPRTYIDFMGDRLAESAVSKRMISKGVDFAGTLGFDVEFVTVVNSTALRAYNL